MKGFIACFTCLLLATVIFASEYQECKNDSECGPNNCCVIGLQRYSIPECTPKGRLGDFCREGAEPETKILLYPNMRYLYLEKVWFEVAPCEDNLICFENVCA